MNRKNNIDKPQRSCLSCRKTVDKDLLLRFVLSPEGEVFPDLDAKLPGRGAYTCCSSQCLVSAVKQRQFNRAFKKEVGIMSSDCMMELIATLMRDKILGYLGLAKKAGKIISGGSLVTDAARSRNKPGLILVATDISEAIGEKIVTLAAVHKIPCEQIFMKSDFGEILGKAPRSAVAVRLGGFVPKLVSEIEKRLS